MKNLIRSGLKTVINLRTSLFPTPFRQFSVETHNWTEDEVKAFKNKKTITTAYYDQEMKDLEDLKKEVRSFYMKNKRYQNITEKWKIALVNKQKKRERKLERQANREKPKDEEAKLVVHSDAIESVELNSELMYNSFAVISLSGSQHKVTMDNTLILNRFPELKVGETIEINDVHLIGNRYFTMIGRPIVNSARVVLGLEEQTFTKKIIVFKKKRRKGYKKNMGYSHPVSIFRVLKVEYDIPDEIAKKAVRL